MGNKKGMVLNTTLFLTALALILVLTVLYMLWYSTKTSGSVKQYATALEAAKSAASYVVNKFEEGDLTCNSGQICNDNGSVDLGYAGYMSNYTITATVIKKYTSKKF